MREQFAEDILAKEKQSMHAAMPLSECVPSSGRGVAGTFPLAADNSFAKLPGAKESNVSRRLTVDNK